MLRIGEICQSFVTALAAPLPTPGLVATSVVLNICRWSNPQAPRSPVGAVERILIEGSPPVLPPYPTSCCNDSSRNCSGWCNGRRNGARSKESSHGTRSWRRGRTAGFRRNTAPWWGWPGRSGAAGWCSPVLAAAPPGPSAVSYGLIDINRAQDVPARVTHVVGFDHPVVGNLPLVTEVPLHHASDRHVPRNADVGASPPGRPRCRGTDRLSCRSGG